MKIEYIKKIEDYCLEKISREDLQVYFQDKIDFLLLDNMLELALGIHTKSGVFLFDVILHSFYTKINNEDRDKIQKKYVEIRTGHEEHEDLIQVFFKNTTDIEENIRILLSLIEEPPKYFERAGRTEVFIMKCLFQLKSLPSDRALEEFKKFANSENEDIASYVRIQLAKEGNI